MKKSPEDLHRERMHDIHALFAKKMQYHRQHSYLDLKDIYWLVHEFFTTFLGKDAHFTEQELLKELQEFKHEFISIDPPLLAGWKAFFEKLSHYQYGGVTVEQEHLKALLEEFSDLVDETVGKERAPSDQFSQRLQTAMIYVKHGDVEKAHEAYKKLMTDYEHLSEQLKQQHYEQLEQLYQAIAVARSA